MTAALLILAAFIIGFLLGDRRAVKQFNKLVTEHNDRLESIILEQAMSEPAQLEESEIQTLH